MLAIFSKIVEKYDQHFFFHPISMQFFSGYESDDFKKQKNVKLRKKC